MDKLTEEQLQTFLEICNDPSWFINRACIDRDHPVAFDNWRQLNWYIFDVETTGFLWLDEWTQTADRNFGICQFYSILYKNRDKVQTQAGLLNPRAPINAGATEVHKITDEDVSEEPTFKERFDEGFFEGIKSADLFVAHNARFDLRALVYEMVANDFDVDYIKAMVNIPFLDTLVFERERSGKMRGNRLDQVCKRFGIKMMAQVAYEKASLHDAATDVEALAALLPKLADTMPYTLHGLIDIQSDLMASQDAYMLKRYGPKEG